MTSTAHEDQFLPHPDDVAQASAEAMNGAARQIAALAAQPAASAEPVARATVYMRDGRRQVLICELGTAGAAALTIGEHDLYAAPVAAQAPAANADALDAARYRWLRGHFRFAFDSDCEIWFDGSLKNSPADQLDAVIDAARQGEGGAE